MGWGRVVSVAFFGWMLLNIHCIVMWLHCLGAGSKHIHAHTPIESDGVSDCGSLSSEHVGNSALCSVMCNTC